MINGELVIEWKKEKSTPIVLTVDEYETIRLLDKKGYSQEQCAASMQVARTTVQRIYEIARKKIADALIDGHPLRIEGGDFKIKIAQMQVLSCFSLAHAATPIINQNGGSVDFKMQHALTKVVFNVKSFRQALSSPLDANAKLTLTLSLGDIFSEERFG